MSSWARAARSLAASAWTAGALLAAMVRDLSPSLLKRRLSVFAVALRVFLDYKAAQQRAKWVKEEWKKDAIWLSVHERSADRVFTAICNLQGLWVKAGQYLSTRADVLPEPYVDRLKLLQDTLPPRPLAEVHRTVEEELGQPLEVAFDYFDPTPLATASIAQVHKARTVDGRDIVVKVQHTGVKERILQDLENLRSIVEWVAWAEPDYDFQVILHEWASEVPKELDFNIEAQNTRRVARNLDYREKAGAGVDPLGTRVDVMIPTILQSTEKVLIMTYMDGVRLNNNALDSLGVDKLAVVESICRAYAHQIYVDGFFNADPHPGNFLVSREAPHRVILLDFGLTKELRPHVQVALAKMLLAAAEGDLSMLLSSFTEMGLKLRMDIPDDAMAVTSFFFRRAAPPKESKEEYQSWHEDAEKRKLERERKVVNEGEKEGSLRRNPIDAFPGELVFFTRVLGLLRGLSSLLEARVAYLEVMRPFAEAVLSSANLGPERRLLRGTWEGWGLQSPPLSDVDRKVRALLLELGRQGKVLGIQVCAYKAGRVVVDVSAGVMGPYDPRPVQPNSLFSVFSATKGVAAAMVHWLADRGTVQLDAQMASFWPEFAANGKEQCTVAHALTHRAGLQNALARLLLAHPMTMCNWEDMLAAIAMEAPEHHPGMQEAYHYLTFGWLLGGIVEKASGRKFKDVLEDAFVKPLGVQGEFYIGIPPGVESRLTTLVMDKDELQGEGSMSMRARLAEVAQQRRAEGLQDPPLPASSAADLAAAAAPLPLLFNTLFIRRAVIPAANGHFSARALARFYAALAGNGQVPELPTSSTPPLGQAQQLPEVAEENKVEGSERARTGLRLRAQDKVKMMLGRNKGAEGEGKGKQDIELDGLLSVNQTSEEREKHLLFLNPNIVDAFVAGGEYSHLSPSTANFGLGFQLFHSPVDSPPGLGRNLEPLQRKPSLQRKPAFGHAGLGGSVAFCDPESQFSIAVTLNKLTQRGEVAAAIVRLVCSELGVPVPAKFRPDWVSGADMLRTVA